MRVRQVVTGNTMVVLATVGLSNVIRIGSSMTLTRLLDAEAFGIVGIVMSLSFTLALLSDLSFTPYVIRHPEGGSRRFLDEVWTIRLIRSFFLAGITFLLAGPAAHYEHQPTLKAVLQVYSIQFIFEGVGSLSQFTAIRTGQLRRLSMLDLAVSLFQVITSIILALIFRSYWALLVTIVAAQGMRALLSYVMFPNAGQRFVISRARMRDLWGFSRLLILSSMLTVLISQTDKVILSPLLPLAVFGLYSIANTLATAPVSFIGSYVSRILLPDYAQAWRAGGTELRAIYYRRKRKIMLLYMFAMGGLIGGAHLLVAILYDPRFTGVAIFLQMLALVTTLQFNNDAATEALIAAGRASTQLWANLTRICWLALGTCIALELGRPIGIVAVVATMEVPATGYFWRQLHRLGIFSLREEMVGPLVCLLGIGVGTVLAHVGLALLPLL